MLNATKGGSTDYFTYDGLNRQVTRKVGSNAIIYNVYDGWGLIGEYAAAATNPSAAYIYGAGGLVKGINIYGTFYFYQDASGSASHLTNSSGQLQEWYRYDLQGTPTVYDPNGNVRTGGTIYGIRHLFTGQQWYSELGLYDLRNRYYSPDIGRFLQADPASFGGDATNLYRYCANNPLMQSDPSGLDSDKAYAAAAAFNGSTRWNREGGGEMGDMVDAICQNPFGGAGTVGPGMAGLNVEDVSGVTLTMAEAAYSLASYSTQQALHGFSGFLAIAQVFGSAGLDLTINAQGSPLATAKAQALLKLANGRYIPKGPITITTRGFGNGNGWESSTAAAYDAIDTNMRKHIAPAFDGIEIGGGLYQNTDASWFYTVIDAPLFNDTSHCWVFTDVPGHDQLAAWHIHPGAQGTLPYGPGPGDDKLNLPNYFGMPDGSIGLIYPGGKWKIIRQGHGP